MEVTRVCRISPYASLKEHTQNCPGSCEIIHRNLVMMASDVRAVWKRYEAWKERRAMRELQRIWNASRIEK